MGWDAHIPVNSAFLGKTEKQSHKDASLSIKTKITPAVSSYNGIDKPGDKRLNAMFQLWPEYSSFPTTTMVF
jgi:hypothetical protein